MEDLMNAASKVLLVVVLLVAVVAAAGANDKVQVAPRVTKDLIVTNLMQGLCTQNKGVRESAAFMLGEQKAIAGVVPLMKMLRDCDEESSRIVAALSLARIGDPRGTYAVKQAARFDKSQKVRTLCAWFYNQYVQAGSFAFIDVEPDKSVEYGSR
jgi:HEAT repeat protein